MGELLGSREPSSKLKLWKWDVLKCPLPEAPGVLKNSISRGTLEVLAAWKFSSLPMPSFLVDSVSLFSPDGMILTEVRSFLLGRSSLHKLCTNCFVLFKENALKNIQLVFFNDKGLRTNSEPESIVSVKLKKVESKEKAGKGDDGPWQSGILFHVWDLFFFFFIFQGWDLFFHFFAFLGTLHEFEPLPHAEGHGEGENGEDGVDIAEASKNDVSQLLHNAFWRILSMKILSSDFFKTPAPAVLLGSSWRLPQKSGRATTRPGLTRKKRQIWLLHSFCLHFKGVLVQPI